MSQTAPQHKRTRFRDWLLQWMLTPLRALRKARKRTPSKTAPGNVPRPVRPGHKRLPPGTRKSSGAPQGRPMPPARPLAPKPSTIPQTQPNRLTTVLGTDSKTNNAVTISLEERRLGQYVIGGTGTGKTTLLLNMILSDIFQNRGLCLIEPHGDLTKHVIAAMPQRRLKDMIYLDITDSSSSFGLNFFECPAGADLAEVAKVASFVMHLFESVWSAHTETTPRLAQVLRNTTRLLIENPGMTFAEIPLLLWEDGVREKLVRRVSTTQTKIFWSQYNRKQPRDREELTASTMNKVDAYLNEPLVSRIVSQSVSTIDCRRIMNEGKILLVRLSPQLEEPSRLIGAAILGRLLLASFSRSDTQEQNRRPFMLYADEYQRFATNDFAVFLAEARKSWVVTTIAHQTLEQLSDLNRATALQAGTLIVLRVSGEDSKTLAPSFDTTPTQTIVGEEPVRAVVLDPLSHLVKHSHPHKTVAKLVTEYLLPFEALARHMASMLGRPLGIGPLMIHHSHVTEARGLLNRALAACMRDSRPDLFLDPLILFILGGAAGTGIPWVFENHCQWNIFELGEFIGFRKSARQFGEAAFLENKVAVKALVNRYAKKTVYSQTAGHNIIQTPGPTFIEMLTCLRQTMGILAKEPLLTDTGLYQPKYQNRTYIDQENLVANELSQLPNYTAKVKLLTGEYTIKTPPAPALVSEPEVEARIQAIKERMLLQGYTVPAQAVEEEVRKRHEALRARPESDAPPPRHANGNRRGRTKPTPSANT